MAGRCEWLFCVVVVGLHVTAVLPSTLYQWLVDSRTRFNYDPDRNNVLGVYNWPRSYPESCSGQHQSPVDIDTNRVRYGVECPCPRMIYSNPMLAGELKNNGLSATFEPENNMAFQIMDAPQRPGTYYLNDFHLHFGGVTGRSFELQGMRFRGSGVMSAGSEHTIDGLRFEGEIHFVFYNSKYMNLEEAESKHDGVVVITLLVQKIPGTMADNSETSEFSQFLETNIPRIYPYLQNVSLELDLRIFFNRMCEFYTYTGSITTPTCHESVRWIILREPLRVTERAWFSLTGMQSRGDFNSRFGNYRTTQPLNDRVIEANFQRTEGAIRPMPNGSPIRGPGMPMGVGQQPDVPMSAAGNRSPMLNNNPNVMTGATDMSVGGNRSPMLIRNPNLMTMSAGIPMSLGANRSPMLNGNPNLMAMPAGMPSPGANRSPMLNGNPNLMAMPAGMPSHSANRSPMLNGSPRLMAMPAGMPSPGANRSSMLNGNPRLMAMPAGMPMSSGANRSPMLNGNPNLMSIPRAMPMSSGGNSGPVSNIPMSPASQMSMPVFDQNVMPRNNNNNNNDDSNSAMNGNGRRTVLNPGPITQIGSVAMPVSNLNPNSVSLMKGGRQMSKMNAGNNIGEMKSMPKAGKNKTNQPVALPGMLNWWNLNLAYMRHMKSKVWKMWQMYMGNRMGYYF